MNMDFKRKLPTPKEVKEMFPLSEELAKVKQQNDEEIQAIIRGDSKKLLLIIGPFTVLLTPSGILGSVSCDTPMLSVTDVL